MKANDFIEKVESFGQKKWILWGIWGIYTLLIIALCSIHEPWSDEYHVWGMVSHLSFHELWDAMRVEGHFCLWHLCVWPWVNVFGMDYNALFVASSLLMSGAVWLLLFKLKFSFIGKLFIVFSSPFFYYFPVVARCYSLIPPILIATAIVYQKQKNPFLYCFLVGLLAHTHAYMEGMVGILWCLFIYYYVYIPYKNGESQRAKKNAYASIITVGFVLLAFMQIMGGIVDAIEGTSVAMNRVSNDTDWLLSVYGKHHIKLSTTLHQRVSNFVPKIDLPITLFLYVTVSILLYKLIQLSKDKTEYIWIVFVSVIWQILFAINIYSMWFQRVYLLYLPILYVIWISSSNDKKIGRYATYIVICLWLLNTPAQNDIIKDIVGVYSHDLYAANQIEQMISDKTRPVVAYETFCGELLSNISYHDSNTMNIDSILALYNKDMMGVYLISSKEIDTTDFSNNSVEFLYTTIEGADEFGYALVNGKRTVYLYRIGCDNAKVP